MANASSPCCRGTLLVLLAVAQAVAALATPGAPAEAPSRARQLLPREYIPPPPTAEAGAVVPAAAAACVQSVLEASRPCAADVIQTLVFKIVHLSAECCRVLAGVGEECVAAVFSGGDVGPAVVNSVCGLVASIG